MPLSSLALNSSCVYSHKSCDLLRVGLNDFEEKNHKSFEPALNNHVICGSFFVCLVTAHSTTATTSQPQVQPTSSITNHHIPCTTTTTTITTTTTTNNGNNINNINDVHRHHHYTTNWGDWGSRRVAS